MDFTAALLTDAAMSFSLEQVTLGETRPDEVLVRMIACGICHTDVTVRDGHLPIPRPVILGHEGSGIVERIGSAVTKVRVGDPVALTFLSCGSCVNCREEAPAYCGQFNPLNMSGFRADGTSALTCGGTPVGGHFFGQSSFARYAVANQRNVIRVRKDVPLEMLGPFGCGIQTGAGAIMNVLRPAAGESVVVVGAGGVGLSGIMAAAALGNRRIFVVEPQASRRQLALTLGATGAIDPREGDLTQAIMAATSGGAHVIFDTTGIPAVVDALTDAIAPKGRLGLVGMHGLEARGSYSVVGLIGRGATIRGIIEGDSIPDTFIPKLIDLFMDGRFPVDKMIKFYDFQAINQAFADQVSGAAVKAVLRFA